MNLASLFSGGKDSIFAIFKAGLEGHNTVCLISIFPHSDDSHLLHYHNIRFTSIQAKAMKIPQLVAQVNKNDDKKELDEITSQLEKAKKEFRIEGIVHGGILSEYQKDRFEKIAKKLDLKVISPLWQCNQKEYLNELLKSNFKFIITSVTSEGLDDSWLGHKITREDIENLENLSAKHGFNISFEGGEAETFVVDCPLFSKPIKIIDAKKIWDGYRGRFEITDAILDK